MLFTWPALRSSACAIVHTVEGERALTGEYAGKEPKGAAPRPLGDRAVRVPENDSTPGRKPLRGVHTLVSDV